jgi:hypothetical protein
MNLPAPLHCSVTLPLAVTVCLRQWDGRQSMPVVVLTLPVVHRQLRHHRDVVVLQETPLLAQLE